MNLTNTARDYGSVAKWLHWLTAILFLGSYVSVYYLEWFTERGTTANLISFQLHLSIGATIAVVVFLRIFWKICNRSPDQEPGTRLEHFLAHADHYVLYAIMVIMPLTGYFGTGGNINYFFLLELPKFENTQLFTVLVNNGLGLSFKEFEKPMDFIHKELLGAWLAWILILEHVAAAIYHHRVKKDRTLLKMTSSR